MFCLHNTSYICQKKEFFPEKFLIQKKQKKHHKRKKKENERIKQNMQSTHYETKTEGSRGNLRQQPSATSETNETFAFPTTGLQLSTATNEGSTFSFQPRTTGSGAAMSNGFSAPRPSGFAFGTTSVAPRRVGFSFCEPMRRSTTGFSVLEVIS